MVIVVFIADDAWLPVHRPRAWWSCMHQKSLFCTESK